MSATITELLEELHNEIEHEGYNPSLAGVDDDEDLQCFALRFLLSNLDEALVHTVWCSEHDCLLEDCPPHHDPNRRGNGPVCAECGRLTYFKHNNGKNYCIDHLPPPPPAVIETAINLYQTQVESGSIEDEWYVIGQEWDLNIYLSANEILCATIYPVTITLSTETKRYWPVVSDPSSPEVK